MEPIVKIETEWSEEPATGEPCSACKEAIYSAVNVLNISVNGKIVDSYTRVCNACKELIKNGL